MHSLWSAGIWCVLGREMGRKAEGRERRSCFTHSHTTHTRLSRCLSGLKSCWGGHMISHMTLRTQKERWPVLLSLCVSFFISNSTSTRVKKDWLKYWRWMNKKCVCFPQRGNKSTESIKNVELRNVPKSYHLSLWGLRNESIWLIWKCSFFLLQKVEESWTIGLGNIKTKIIFLKNISIFKYLSRNYFEWR